ncbi:MAG: helix-turn-helix domain-containing protein [Candidatus Poseidoniaceae archaeon]|jgi:sugar-specific transcriptional regulator TrmB/predicted hydrocarbon binding protein
MNWAELFQDAGLSEREARSVEILSSSKELKASELAKKLGTNRLDAYNSLSRLTEIGLVNVTADRPMRFSCSSLPVLFKRLIKDQRERIDRTSQSFEKLMSGAKPDYEKEEQTNSDETNARFAVLKGREHIHKKIANFADEAEERLILLLGRFGILHLCRSSGLEEVNSAAQRGVVVTVIAQLDRRTVRFYDQLDESIEVRHTDEISSLGLLQDSNQVIQFLYVEENPVGRGRDDAALVIHSDVFNSSHSDFVSAIWSEAVDFESAKKRFTEERIVDPLRLTIGKGSFLDQFRDALGVNAELPETDTPFNPKLFLASTREINQARTALQGGTVQSLKQLGIDMNTMLRQIGQRIGEELTFSLRKIEGHVEFLSELMDWWEHAGLGELDYDSDPFFHIVVKLAHPEVMDNQNSLPLWELDDGIIEGALMARYPSTGNVRVRRESFEDADGPTWRYTLIFIEDDSDEDTD